MGGGDRSADRRVGDVEEPVNDHAGDGNVEPERERPASDGAVTGEPFAQAAGERDQNERNDHECQNRVRNQNCEVHGANPAMPSEANNPRMEVKIEIKNQKNRGAAKRREHERAVKANSPSADAHVAEEQKNGTSRIERRVGGG